MGILLFASLTTLNNNQPLGGPDERLSTNARMRLPLFIERFVKDVKDIDRYLLFSITFCRR